MAIRILLIGQGLFREGLIRLLAEQPFVRIQGAVGSWKKALRAMRRVQPDVIIVEYGQEEPPQYDLGPILETEGQPPKVIYLSLEENRMIIQDQRHIADARAADLLQALRSVRPNDDENQ